MCLFFGCPGNCELLINANALLAPLSEIMCVCVSLCACVCVCILKNGTKASCKQPGL